jgi:poly(A) polymerase
MDSSPGPPARQPARIIPRSDHPISRRDIDPDALKVLYRLSKSSHLAYLVGGGVRDLLLGRRPKDFDVGTDATPMRIRRLFRNSRIIGRRFPIVHVYFHGGKVVEVSTFRRAGAGSTEGEQIHRDDAWGPPEEDAWRRDLTINGLFYDIDTFSVIDFVGGLDDLESRIIRTIGDPFVRFNEDPVRMIRAIRHAARTGFRIEPETYRAIRELKTLIHNCPPARVLDEFLRELRGGAAEASIRLLRETGLLHELAPSLDLYLAGIDGTTDAAGFWRRLSALDRLSGEAVELSNAVALTVVLGAAVASSIRESEPATRANHPPDIGKLVRDQVVPMLLDLGVSRRDGDRCFHILLAGRRLQRAASDGRIPPSLTRKSYFEDAWAYFRILLESEGWEPGRIEALRLPPGERSRRARRRRRRRRRRATAVAEVAGGAGALRGE